MRVLVLIPLIAALASAQTPTITVQGIVAEMGSTAPLPGVRISVTRGVFLRSATSDEAGRFSISVPPGEYTIRAEREGYFGLPRNRVPESGITRTIVLEPGSPPQKIDFMMHPGGAVSGRIQDSMGSPRVANTVHLMQPRYESGRRTLAKARSMQTDERGEFRFSGIAPGEYILAAEPPRLIVPQVTGAQSVFTWTYFPGTPDPTRATPITVQPKLENRDLNFTIHAEPSFTVSGKVVNPYGGTSVIQPSYRLQPIPPAETNQLFPYGGGHISEEEARNWLFRFRGVLPGKYELLAEVRDQSNYRLQLVGRTLIDVAFQDVANVTITLTAPLQLTGRILLEDGSPLKELPRVRLASTDFPRVTGVSPAFTSQNDTEFILREVFSGTYQWDVELPDGLFVSALRQGDRDAYSDGLIVAGSSTADPIEMVVSDKPALIRGTVQRSNNTVDDITVVLVPVPALRRNLFLYRTTRPDPSGAFELKNVAPGEYTLLGLESVLTGAWLDPEFLAAYDERALKVLTKRGEVSMANVEIILRP